MRAFSYERAVDAEQAVRAVTRPGAKFLAGGTNLLDLMKEGIVRPTRVVNLKSIRGLGDIVNADDGGLVMGALKRLRCNRGHSEEGKLRRRVAKGLEDGEVQEHAGERDGGRVRCAAPEERPHELSNRREIAPSLAVPY